MKTYSFAAFFFFCLVLVPAVAQEKPVIALFPMQNPTGEGWIETLGNTVEEVVSLTLALMGEYEIERPEELPGDLSEKGLLALAREKGYDDIILGECSLTEEGYRFSVTNYDLFKEKITVRAEENFDSLLDSFDAADLLTEALIEGLSGVKVRYGGLTLALLRDEPYRTVIDDVDVGEGFGGSDKFLVGPHTLRFFQDRGDGEFLVSEQSVEILEGETVILVSPIPWLRSSTSEELRLLERKIAAEGDKERRAVLTEALFAEARSLVSGEYYELYRPELLGRYLAWEELYKESPADIIGLEHSSSLLESMYLGHLPYHSLFTAPRELAGSSLSEGAELLQYLMNRKPEPGGIILPATAKIKVDGLADDWKNVSSVFQDDQGILLESPYLEKQNELFDGQDIEWVGIAMDETRIYVAMKTVSSVYSSKRNYNIDLRSNNLIRLECNRKGKYFAIGKMKKGDWDNGQWASSDESSMKGAVKEIVEMSLPWKELFRFMNPVNWTYELQFSIQRNTDPWKQVDEYHCKVFIPEFFYSLRME